MASLTWEGSEPDKIWPVIMPGMLTMPTTFIWFRMGVSATRVARCSVSCAASQRLAPMASFSSMRSLPAEWHRQNDQGARGNAAPHAVHPATSGTFGLLKHHASGLEH